MIRQKIEKIHTPYVKYKYLTQVPCRLNVRVSKSKKQEIQEINSKTYRKASSIRGGEG